MHTIVATAVFFFLSFLFFSHSLTHSIRFAQNTQFESELLLMLPILLLFGYEHRTVFFFFFFKNDTHGNERETTSKEAREKKNVQPNTVAACTSTTAHSVRHTTRQDEKFQTRFLYVGL